MAVEKDPCSDVSSCHASDWDAAHELEEHHDVGLVNDDDDEGVQQAGKHSCLMHCSQTSI